VLRYAAFDAVLTEAFPHNVNSPSVLGSHPG